MTLTQGCGLGAQTMVIMASGPGLPLETSSGGGTGAQGNLSQVWSYEGLGWKEMHDINLLFRQGPALSLCCWRMAWIPMGWLPLWLSGNQKCLLTFLHSYVTISISRWHSCVSTMSEKDWQFGIVTLSQISQTKGKIQNILTWSIKSSQHTIMF